MNQSNILCKAFATVALTRFIDELIQILNSEGFLLEDLLEALASMADKQPSLGEVVNHLEKAASEVRRIHK
ncbi:hypothetical protein [Fischerella sp. JS2]|uniref:hypothetical protein n=1 Tax=Fischerella sp. JS2 TaxID=2597771 RepID=UPI0028E89F23|nr:hypothetical protein [Fischerella sp. JS2]